MNGDDEYDDRLPDQVEQRFAANYRRAREHAGLSQERVAEMMRDEGHTAFRQQTVAKIEANDRSLRLGEALALARVLGTSLDALARPRGAAERAWLLRSSARELRDAARDVVNLVSRSTSARQRVRAEMEKTEKAGLAQELADEMYIARRALADTQLRELRALAEERVTAATGRTLTPDQKQEALRLSVAFEELATDDGPVDSRQQAAFLRAHEGAQEALRALLELRPPDDKGAT